jgi:hypothetical protein
MMMILGNNVHVEIILYTIHALLTITLQCPLVSMFDHVPPSSSSSQLINYMRSSWHSFDYEANTNMANM